MGVALSLDRGTPSLDEGVPHPWMGYSHPWTWGVSHPWLRYTPPPQLDLARVPPPRCELTNKLKLLPSLILQMRAVIILHPPLTDISN